MKLKKLMMAAVLSATVLLSSIPAFAASVIDPEQWDVVSQVNYNLNIFDNKIDIAAANGGVNSWIGHWGCKQAVDPNGFTWEFTLRDAGKYKGQDGFDLWYGFGLSAEKVEILGNSGLFMLFKPVSADNTKLAVFTIDKSANVQNEIPEIDLNIKPTDKMKVELKKDGDSWAIYVNGNNINLPADKMAALTGGFKAIGKDGKAYPYLGVNSQPPFDKMKAGMVITKMEEGKADASTPAPAEDKKDDSKPADTKTETTTDTNTDTKTETTSNPSTGDVSILLYAAAAGLSGLTLAARKRK